MTTAGTPPKRSAVLELLRKYVDLSGGDLQQTSSDLFLFRPSRDDRSAFGGRTTIRVAFSVDAIENDTDAEMGVVGSGFFRRLTEAIRSKGHRQDLGFVSPTVGFDTGTTHAMLSVKNAEVDIQRSERSWIPIGSLLTHVSLRAGNELEERLAETGVFDLSSGRPLNVAWDELGSPVSERPHHARAQPSLAVRDLVAAMAHDLERSLADEIAEMATGVDRSLKHELTRLDAYYATIYREALSRPNAKVEALDAIRREHALRRNEQIERHRVRCVVRPVQLRVAHLPAETAHWQITAPGRRPVTMRTERHQIGSAEWSVHCPTCHAGAADLVLCIDSHVSCEECTAACSVCSSAFCDSHGIAACHLDGRPACRDHSAICEPCGEHYCNHHEVRCDRAGHPVCAACAGPCAVCEVVTCDLHGASSHEAAPLGARRLCRDCLRTCDGGRGEVVGIDEVHACANCGRDVCSEHAMACAVDGAVLCASHLRRTDTSRRFVCDRHQDRCLHEAEAVFATDELRTCETCGGKTCSDHGDMCAGGDEWHCRDHLEPLEDRPGALACSEHRAECHIDGLTYSPDQILACPICSEVTCANHCSACEFCRRRVCVADLRDSRCRTCHQLREERDPADELVEASRLVRTERMGRPLEWMVARDASHRVAAIKMSAWRRTLVITVPHGVSEPETAVLHGVLRSTRLR